MAVTARETNIGPVTRIYPQTEHDFNALPQKMPVEPKGAPQKKPSVRKKPKLSRATKIKRTVSVCSVLMVAAALIAIMLNYAAISYDYSSLNEMNAKIDELNRYIDKLRVDIEYNVSNSDVNGFIADGEMCYPEDNRIIDVAP